MCFYVIKAHVNSIPNKRLSQTPKELLIQKSFLLVKIFNLVFLWSDTFINLCLKYKNGIIWKSK